MSDRLLIANEMRVFDQKDRTFYTSLTEEERKKFSNFLMLRWGSCVAGSSELQEFYIVSTNLRLNVNFFAMSKHPELQWLMATTVSPGIGVFKHNWIAPKKREGGSNKAEKFLAKIYPTTKMDEINLMAQLMTTAELKKLAETHGYTKEQIKKEL